ncbi:hypothetical protein G9A89_012160 [Geosiphon pyriformis]|nr:hypothetical protein G9A89_012160 [Geosiphon pyriformis]
MQDQPLQIPAPTPPPPPPTQPVPIQPAPQTQQGTLSSSQVQLASHPSSLSSRVPTQTQVGRPTVPILQNGVRLPVPQHATVQRQNNLSTHQLQLSRQSPLQQTPQPISLAQSPTQGQPQVIQQIRILPQTGAGSQINGQRSPTQVRPILAQASGPIPQTYQSDNRTTPTIVNGSGTVTPTQSQRPPQFGSFASRPQPIITSSSRISNSQPSQLTSQSTQSQSNSHGSVNSNPPLSPQRPSMSPVGQSSSQIFHATHSALNIQNSQHSSRTLAPGTNLTQSSRPSTPQRQTHSLVTTQLLSSPSSSAAVSAAKVLEWAASQRGNDEKYEEPMRYIKSEPSDAPSSNLLAHYPEVDYEEEEEHLETTTEFMRIKKELSDDDDGSLKEQEIGFTPHNRGNKLKRRAEALSGNPKLRAPYGYHEDLEHVIGPSGQRRHIIYRIPKDVDKMLEFSGDEEDNPYKEDIVKRPALKRVLKDQRLSKLSAAFSQMIEDEHSFNKVLNRLYTILQGDDPMYQELDFRINPLPETVTTRVSKTEKSEGGSGFGVLNMGLQGNESIKGKRALEAKDDGLETLKDIREKLLEQLDYSRQFLRKMTAARDLIIRVCRQKEKLYCRMKERNRRETKSRYINDPAAASSSSTLLADPGNIQASSSSNAQGSISALGSKEKKSMKRRGKSRKVQSTMEKTHYDTLGVLPSASNIEIKEAYQRLVVLTHPDKQVVSKKGSKERVEHQTSIQEILEAWKTLRDPDSRKGYDGKIKAAQLKKGSAQGIVNAELDLDEMTYDEETSVYTIECRCGGRYSISEEDLEKGAEIVGCENCSLKIRILYDVIEDNEDVYNNEEDINDKKIEI